MIVLPPRICLYRIKIQVQSKLCKVNHQSNKRTTATGEDLAWIRNRSRGLGGKLFVSSPCKLLASKFTIKHNLCGVLPIPALQVGPLRIQQ